MAGNSRRMGTFGQLIFGVVLVVAGYLIGFVVLGGYMEKAEQARAWPTTAGLVKDSGLVESRNSDGNRMYRAEVIYTYSVQGRSYESSSISPGSSSMKSSNRGGAQKTANRFPAGAQVEVYYNPESPGEAFLLPEVSQTLRFFRWVFIIGFMGLGFLLLLSSVKWLFKAALTLIFLLKKGG